MRTGIFLSYAGGFKEAADQVVELEKVGIDIALVAEAYSFDAISQLGYLAAKTSTIELGTGVVPIYTRTPSLLAMTAAGVDHVSDGRFRLGIGTSGPQVVEGSTAFHSTRRWAARVRWSRSAGGCGVARTSSSTASTTSCRFRPIVAQGWVSPCT
jgi:alkanesulfonate monooxygenase SsuD/methylene tetrahydromethanopterin reductase-like flavin-dependent oxidoreductase (luciferase family)